MMKMLTDTPFREIKKWQKLISREYEQNNNRLYSEINHMDVDI